MISRHNLDVWAAALLTLAAVVVGAIEARAAVPVRAEVRIEHLTWVEVRDLVAAGHRTVLIPTGGTEQNGAHMVTGKHNAIVAETAQRIALALGDALVAPVLAYVPEGDIATRAGHMAYPGTISLPEPVFAGVLEAAAASFKAHGFTTIVLLGDSGGNQRMQDEVAARLTKAWDADGVTVLNASAYYKAERAKAWLASQGESDVSIRGHASLRDTSELLAVQPDGIRRDMQARGGNGADGDAAHASAELGETLITFKVEDAVEEIRAATAKPRAAVARQGAPSSGLLARLMRLIRG